MNYENEIWKPVEGLEDFYEVSNMGRWKILQREIKAGYGKTRVIKEKITCGIKRGRYLKVSINTTGESKDIDLHIMVARAFIPNPENKPTVNHKKGIKTDNRASELEWATQSEQLFHSYEFKLRSANGEKNGRAKLTETQVVQIRNLFKTGQYTKTKLSKEFMVGLTTIRMIINKKNWKHVA